MYFSFFCCRLFRAVLHCCFLVCALFFRLLCVIFPFFVYFRFIRCYLSPFSFRVICFVSGLIPFLFFLFRSHAVEGGCVFSNFHSIGGNPLVLLTSFSRVVLLSLFWTSFFLPSPQTRFRSPSAQSCSSDVSSTFFSGFGVLLRSLYSGFFSLFV